MPLLVLARRKALEVAVLEQADQVGHRSLLDRMGGLADFVPHLGQAVQLALASQPRSALQEDDVLDAVVACVTAAIWDQEATISATAVERCLWPSDSDAVSGTKRQEGSSLTTCLPDVGGRQDSG